MNVFIIVNEWVASDDAEGAEVVGGKYFTSESDAWDALKLIADSYGTHLRVDQNSLSFSNHEPHLQYEEYYIQELTKG